MRRLKAALGRFVRRIYDWLPVRWSVKIAIKDKILLWIAPFVRNTTAFKRWQAFGNGADLA